jgi:hypothetical protein
MAAELCATRTTPLRETSQPRTRSLREYSAVDAKTPAIRKNVIIKPTNQDHGRGMTPMGRPKGFFDSD